VYTAERGRYNSSVDGADLLEAYLEWHSPEAQEWNLSPENLFIEYTTRELLRRWLPASGAVCNVGIGTGEWDDYLGYWLGERGRLTSIDVDPAICERFEYRQRRERHPFPATVLNRSILAIDLPRANFDLVTMIGSTLQEIGDYRGALDACFSLLKPGGVFFYMDFTTSHSAILFDEYAANAGHIITNRTLHGEFPEVEFYVITATRSAEAPSGRS
jgi:SAM-dependent methyltransferase